MKIPLNPLFAHTSNTKNGSDQPIKIYQPLDTGLSRFAFYTTIVAGREYNTTTFIRARSNDGSLIKLYIPPNMSSTPSTPQKTNSTVSRT